MKKFFSFLFLVNFVILVFSNDGFNGLFFSTTLALMRSGKVLHSIGIQIYFKKQDVIDAFVNSITIAVITTIVTTVLGVFFAIALHRYKYRFEGAINGLVYLPILIPDILMGLSLLILFSQLGMELGQTTIIIAHITFSISFVVVILAARLSSMGRDLEEAANDLGATPWQTFRYVTFPAIAPGVISAALLTFTLSIDDFVISFFVSGPGSTTLPLYIYSMVKREYHQKLMLFLQF